MANVDWAECPVLESDPERVSGAWVFRGTRVPVSAILRNLTLPMDELLENYPSISRSQIETVLDFLADAADPAFTGVPAAIVIHADSAR
jgi:uncharacterized protein (DUF433 family)